MKKILMLATIFILSIGALAACSSGGDGEDKNITVGAKNFTEQFILAKMAILKLEDNGYSVEEKSNLGSSALRQALENKQVDLTWDYTGTGLVTYMGEDPIADKQEAYDTVKELDMERNDIYWTNLSEVNNAYTIVMTQEKADELAIESIGDLAEYVNNNPDELRFGTDAEFANRDDGLPGVEETYGFEFGDANISEMNYGLQYEALNNEEVDVAMGFATDSRIREYELVNLEDTESFFPSYNAAIAMTNETYENHPEVEEILKPIAEQLDSETMRELNYQVDVEERSVDDVAQTYLEENGLLDGE
ncbi:glycine betaine ABC transporter substrate-binding protein [Halobacillus seohaensis]|uniref:Glycine betaine ABC transporter substrate-binding protein n=1 Tax=Halobacillus seohaensis TaxID=447421 RepID=A0ABW2ELX1_9BACI